MGRVHQLPFQSVRTNHLLESLKDLEQIYHKAHFIQV